MFLGRAHYRHGLRVPLEEHLLVMAPPRTYKTAFLADVILRYPGPVIATTTKPDIYALTAAVRAGLGGVHVFNPQDIGGVPSTFSWSPVEGCEDPATAIRRADAFAFAVSQKGVEDGSFWSSKASDYLRGYFHAAALAGYDLRAVAAWVSGADPDLPEQILAAAGAHQWAITLSEFRLCLLSRVDLVQQEPARVRRCHVIRHDGVDVPVSRRAITSVIAQYTPTPNWRAGARNRGPGAGGSTRCLTSAPPPSVSAVEAPVRLVAFHYLHVDAHCSAVVHYLSLEALVHQRLAHRAFLRCYPVQ